MMIPNKNGYSDNFALRVAAAYERGVTDGFAEAIHEVKRGEINPQTWVRPATKVKDK